MDHGWQDLQTLYMYNYFNKTLGFWYGVHVTINQETESTGNKAGLKQILHRILVGTALESGKSN